MPTARHLALLAALAVLPGCVAVEGGTYAGPIYLDRSVPDPLIGPSYLRPEPRRTCESYADQTYRNVYEDLADPRDGFGSNVQAQRRAERAGDRAYERCLSGRRN